MGPAEIVFYGFWIVAGLAMALLASLGFGAWEVGVLGPQYRETGVRSMVRGMDRVRH